MSLLNWLFDFYQQHRIGTLRNEATQARAEAMALRGAGGSVDLERLERALGELALAVKTIQRIAVEKGLCSPEEFRRKLQAIDLEDGAADGRAPLR